MRWSGVATLLLALTAAVPAAPLLVRLLLVPLPALRAPRVAAMAGAFATEANVATLRTYMDLCCAHVLCGGVLTFHDSPSGVTLPGFSLQM